MIKKRSVRMVLFACASVASLGLLMGPATAAAKKKAKAVTKTATVNTCVNQSVFIPDNESGDGFLAVAAPLMVSVPKFRGKPQDGLVTAVNSAGVRITHTHSADLALFLVSPGGRAINLAESADSSADGFGTGAAGCGGSLFQFSDSASTSIVDISSSGDDPLTGTFRPFQPLSTLASGPARGNWTLVAHDDSSADSGTINALSLSLTYTYKALKKAKKKK